MNKKQRIEELERWNECQKNINVKLEQRIKTLEYEVSVLRKFDDVDTKNIVILSNIENLILSHLGLEVQPEGVSPMKIVKKGKK